VAKTTYMIVTGASVVVVRDGKRKPLPAGSGEDFTESEIAAILKAVPGSLRKPINEGGQSAADADEGDDDATKDAGTKQAKKAGTKGKTAATPTKAKKAAKKAVETADDADDDDDDSDGGDDADEDEDI
jgi:hypothetical protein